MTIRPIVVEIVLISSVPRIKMSTFLAAPHAKAPRHLAISPDSRNSDGFVYQEGSRRGPLGFDSSGSAPEAVAFKRHGRVHHLAAGYAVQSSPFRAGKCTADLHSLPGSRQLRS